MPKSSNQIAAYSADGAETWWTDGLSHDMANVLTVIQSTCELLKDAAKEGEKQLICGMIQACRRGSSLLTPTRRWWQHSDCSRDKTDISDALQEVAQMAASFAPDVEILVYQNEKYFVDVPPPVIFRCLMNIAINAIDAYRENKTECPSRIEIHANGSESVVRLTIKDCGPGIPPDVLPRIFEPLFSTKATTLSSRRGLGLYVVQNLLAEFGGTINVVSNAEQGSSFYLEFARGEPSEDE